MPADAIPEERQALGLPLTCAEERQLARVNIKDVDMAMFWYLSSVNRL